MDLQTGLVHIDTALTDQYIGCVCKSWVGLHIVNGIVYAA